MIGLLKALDYWVAKAVITESYERIHRSNLIGMGILPLQFKSGENRQSLTLDGSEVIDIHGTYSVNSRW